MAAELSQEWQTFFFELDDYLSRIPAVASEVAGKDPKLVPMPEYIGAMANGIQNFAAGVAERGAGLSGEHAERAAEALSAAQAARVLRGASNLTSQAPIPQKIGILKRGLGAAARTVAALAVAGPGSPDLSVLAHLLAGLDSLL